MEKFDSIIVGAGLSGLTAAYYLAKAGLQVIALERGDLPGSKNVTGGRLYLGPIRDMVPDLLEGAPLERQVTNERVSILTEESSTTLSFRSGAFREPSVESYTVLRANLDRWLGDRVMEAGAFVIPQKRVNAIIREGERVVGIRSDGEEIFGEVVVIAEGVLSMLCEQMGLRPRLAPEHSATAVKEVIELPPDDLEKRFGLLPGEGAAHLFIGSVTRGLFGGGFLYTNRESVSLGIVVGMEALLSGGEDLQPHELMEAFKQRPEVSPLIAEGKTIEYSAHLIPEGGFRGLVKPFGDGYLIVGDAAGLALNMGITVRGMDLAMASGFLAAKTILRAREMGDYSRNALSHYQRLLEGNFVMKDLRAFQYAGEILAKPRMHTAYPRWLNETMRSLYTIGPGPKERFARTTLRAMKGGPNLASVLRDLWAMRKL